MNEREDIVVAIVAAAPKAQMTSRIRLQKTVYLLDRLGFKSGFEFDYHHYGPYSRDLDNATADAKALKLLDENTRYRVRDGASYSVFHATSDAKPDVYSHLSRENVARFVAQFAETNVTVLELAATVDWLREKEMVSDWRAEVRARKGPKTEGGRLEKAVELLTFLGLGPVDQASSTG
jgi:uncharacterized protein YwgA